MMKSVSWQFGFLRRVVAIMLCVFVSVAFLPLSGLGNQKAYADDNYWENIDEIRNIHFVGAKKVRSLGIAHAIIDSNNDLYMTGSYNLNGATYDHTKSTVKIMSDVKDVYVDQSYRFGSGVEYFAAVKLDGSLMAWGHGYDRPTEIEEGVDRVVLCETPYIYYVNEKSEFRRIRYDAKQWHNISSELLARDVRDAACNFYYPIVILKKDGSVWSWKKDSTDHLIGDPIKGIDNVKSISPGTAITKDNELYVWEISSDGPDIPGTFEAPAKIADNVKMGLNDGHYIDNDGFLWYRWFGIDKEPKVIMDDVAWIDVDYEYQTEREYAIKNDGSLINNVYDDEWRSKMLDDVVMMEGSIALKKDGTVWVWRGGDGYYDLTDYSDEYYSYDYNVPIEYGTSPSGEYVSSNPRKIEEKDLYGKYYRYLVNRTYDKMCNRLTNTMGEINSERTIQDNKQAILISNFKEGGVESVINAGICLIEGEYYKQHELEEKLALQYLQSITNYPDVTIEVIKGINGNFKNNKKAYELASAPFKSVVEKRQFAEAMQGGMYNSDEVFELIKETENNWSKIDKQLKSAGRTLQVGEVVAGIVIARQMNYEMTSRLMENVDPDSSLYKGLERVRRSQDYPVTKLIAKMLQKDVFKNWAKGLTSKGIKTFTGVLDPTRISLGYATVVADVGYYVAGSVLDHYHASSDEVVSSIIAVSNQSQLKYSLGRKLEEISENAGKDSTKTEKLMSDYKLLYQAYVSSIITSVDLVLEVAKDGKAKSDLEKYYALYKDQLSYEKYIESCLRNANAEWKYKKEDDGKVTIIDYKDTKSKNTVKAYSSEKSFKAQAYDEGFCVDVPEEVDGYEVTRIGAGAFRSMDGLEYISLPDSVEEIGERGFADCYDLKDIFMGAGLKDIGSVAFSSCWGLSLLELPKGMNSIGEYAFDDIDDLVIKSSDASLPQEYADEYDNISFEEKSKELTGVSITKSPNKQSYKMSEIVRNDGGSNPVDTTGLELKVTYDDGTTEIITDGFIADFSKKNVGDSTIDVYYKGFIVQYNVQVTADECPYVIVYENEYGEEIANRKTGKELAGNTITINSVDIDGYLPVQESQTVEVGGYNVFHVEYVTKKKPSLWNSEIIISTNKLTYSGKKQQPGITVRSGGKTLSRDVDYSVAYYNNINAGTAIVEVVGKGDYSGENLKMFTIRKAANPITVKTKYLKAKAKKLKKKNVKFTAKKAFVVRNALGKVSYKKVSGNKKISVGSNGNITLKKKIKKGTYKIKVRVTSSGNKNYYSGSRTVTLRIKIK